VMAKLGAHTQLEAVVLATKAGLLQPRPQGR
jgi:DNA-binding CsgD family transcriptional regulator